MGCSGQMKMLLYDEVFVIGGVGRAWICVRLILRNENDK